MFGLLKVVGLGPANLAWLGLGLGGIALGGVGLAVAFVIAPIAFFALPPVSPR